LIEKQKAGQCEEASQRQLLKRFLEMKGNIYPDLIQVSTPT